jgi:hypothetical protein
VVVVEQDYLTEKLFNETDPKYHNDRKYMDKLEFKYVTPMGQHIRHGMMVFINPSVASRPEHDHLFAGDGCYKLGLGNVDGGVPCSGQDRLPDKYNPLLRCFRDYERAKNLGVKNIAMMYWTCISRKETSIS